MKKISLTILCAAGLFAVNGIALAAPPVPNLIGPPNEAVFGASANRLASVTLEWESVSDAQWYHYIIFYTGNGEDYARGDVYAPSTSKISEFSLYDAGNNYTWGVQACKRNWYYVAECSSLNYRTFAIQAGTSNPEPVLTSPANGAVVPTLTPTLTWSWSGDAAQLNTYEIYLTGDLQNNQTEKSLTPNLGQNFYNIRELLKDNKTYTWKVRTLMRGNYANGPWSNSWTFTTQLPSTPALQPPFLLSPVTWQPPITTLTPALTWGERAGANCYEAEITNNIWAGKTADASINVPTGKLQDGQTYNWRARTSLETCALAAGWSDWSGLEAFSVNLSYVPPPGTGGGGTTPGPWTRTPRNNALCPTTGFVPCGTNGCPCQFCDFFVMFNKIVRFVMFTLAPIIATLMLVVGGVMFLTAGAKPDALIQAKGIITSVIIGLVIIFSAWIIVNTVLVKTGIVASPSVLQWYDIGCSAPAIP